MAAQAEYAFEGQLVWKKDFAPQAMEDSLGEGSSPALFGDTLVIVVDQETHLLSEADKTIVLRRGPEIKVLASNQLEGETFHASPTIVGDAIYLRGDKHLFCFAR